MASVLLHISPYIQYRKLLCDCPCRKHMLLVRPQNLCTAAEPVMLGRVVVVWCSDVCMAASLRLRNLSSSASKANYASEGSSFSAVCAGGQTPRNISNNPQTSTPPRQPSDVHNQTIKKVYNNAVSMMFLRL